jgi:spermidine synthase
MPTWFDETLYEPQRQSFRIDRELYRARSAFQEIHIFENATLGRVLALDGVVQVTEKDEHVYHEMLTHLPLLAHGAARKVLIIGGGDGGILEEALKHGIERAVMVEIDGMVIEACRKHLPSVCGTAFDDPHTELIVGDGVKYMAESTELFDLIVVDSTDPVGPAVELFGESFFRNARDRLSECGVLVTQNGVPFFQPQEITETYAKRRKLFPLTGFYVAAIPTYYGGLMALGWASKGLDLSKPNLGEIAERYAKLGVETRYYNPDIHLAAMALPNYVRALMR